MSRENTCELCDGILCLDLGNDTRLIASEAKKDAYILNEGIDKCSIKNEEMGIKRRLTEDIVWELQTPLKGWKLHRAFIQRIQATGGEWNDEVDARISRRLSESIDDPKLKEWFARRAKRLEK